MLRGVVVNAISGAPVRKALVTVLTSPPNSSYSAAVADANGRFVFQPLPPGPYKMFASAAGWIDRTSRGGAIIQLPAGAATEQRIALIPLAAVSGRVLDDSGEPMPNVQVQLLRTQFPRGKPTLVPAGMANSDDRGSYRIFDVLPGSYQLRAQSQMQRFNSVAAAQVYPMQFYGGGPSPASQAPIVIRGGEDLLGLDFRLTSVAPARVIGRVDVPAGVPMHGLSVFLQPKAGVPGMGRGAGVTAEGKFAMEGLEPGRYSLSAMARTVVDRPLDGYQSTIELSPGSTTEVAISLVPGPEVSGILTVDGSPPGNGNFTVSLVSGSDEGQMGQRPVASVGADGKFTLKSVPPGVWDINAMPIPRGSYLKSMHLGKQDVLREEMSIGPGTQGPLTIEISSKGGKLSGGIAGSPPLSSAPFIVLAPDAENAKVLSFFSSAVVEANGKYQLTGLHPGPYKLYAFTGVESGAWFDPAFLPRYSERAVAVKIAEGESVTADAPLIEVKP